MMSLISSQVWRGASTVVFSHELVLDFFLHRSGLVAPEEVRAHTYTHTRKRFETNRENQYDVVIHPCIVTDTISQRQFDATATRMEALSCSRVFLVR